MRRCVTPVLTLAALQQYAYNVNTEHAQHASRGMVCTHHTLDKSDTWSSTLAAIGALQHLPDSQSYGKVESANDNLPSPTVQHMLVAAYCCVLQTCNWQRT